MLQDSSRTQQMMPKCWDTTSAPLYEKEVMAKRASQHDGLGYTGVDPSESHCRNLPSCKQPFSPPTPFHLNCNAVVA